MLTAELRFPGEGGGLNIWLNFDPSKKIDRAVDSDLDTRACNPNRYRRPNVRIKVLVWTNLPRALLIQTTGS